MKSNSIWDYSQPDFYRFSEDSTFLAKYVSLEFSKRNVLKLKGLDLGAGCGVVGLEILRRVDCFSHFSFCELQPEFIPHLQTNTNFISQEKSVEVNILSQSFHQMGGQKYDLIVCNPPYFELGTGRLPHDPRKKLCRFIDSQEWELWLGKITALLNEGGEAYFLQRLDLLKNGSCEVQIELCASFKEVGLFRTFGLHENRS